MKKIIGVISIVFLFGSLAIAQTRLPNGLSIATQTEETATGVTVGAGDILAKDEITGKVVGFYGQNANLVYTVKVATTIAANGIYSFTQADGKAGSYVVQSGTHTASGTFTTGGVVSIGTGTVDIVPITVTDGGTYPIVTNGSTTSRTMMVTYDYVK
jgi:hypothetical protein